MAFLSKQLRLRSISIQLRSFSSILNPDSKTPLTSKEKSRAAISLIKSEKNPERIIEICRAASLTPESHLDRVAFSIAISKLSESNYFEGIRSFLEELKTRPDLKNERFLSHAIVLYGEAGLLDDALQTFKKMQELGVDRTAKSLNALLFSCILAKKYNEVNRIYLEFPKKYDIEPNLDTYNTVIKSFCESGSSNSVYSILAEMDRKQIKPNLTTFATIIAGFYKEEKFDDVENVLKMMKSYNVHPGLSIFNTRIQSLCKLKKSNEAKALLDGILAMGFKPNSETYSNLIFGFCNEGKMDEAKALFKEMGNRRCKVLSGCYFTMVHFLCKNEDFESALAFCKESMEKGWVPNLTTMKTLVNGLASISKVDEARELAGQMKEKFPSFADTWTQIEEALPS